MAATKTIPVSSVANRLFVKYAAKSAGPNAIKY